MKIGIIGTGTVGGTLGKAWAAAGHDVVFGSREPQSGKVRNLLQETGGKARAGSVEEAVASAEVVVLAVPWSAAQKTLRAAGDLDGKVLVDVTNPLAPGMDGLSVGPDTSGGEKVAGWAPGARVVKAFNSTGAENMADPGYGDQRATMFFCGDDADAKGVVAGLGEAIGFEMVDAGPLSNARLLEYLTTLWLQLAIKQGLGRGIAFKLLRR